MLKALLHKVFSLSVVSCTNATQTPRPETMAAGLIRLGLSKEPFFSTAGRAVMAELFRRTQSNAELFEF